MRQLIVSLAIFGMGTGCSTGPDDPHMASYQFYMMAFGADTTAERVRSYDCVVTGNFTVDTPVGSSGTVHFPLFISRTLSERRGNHQAITRADSVIGEAELVYTGLGERTVSFTLTAGPYTVAPAPGDNVPAHSEYAGPWTCGPRSAALTGLHPQLLLL